MGDNYEIKYTTPDNSYVIETEGKSVDVFIRAVNVIGCGKPRKVSIINEYDIIIEGVDSVKVGESSDYDTLNGNGINVEEFCTY